MLFSKTETVLRIVINTYHFKFIYITPNTQSSPTPGNCYHLTVMVAEARN